MKRTSYLKRKERRWRVARSSRRGRNFLLDSVRFPTGKKISWNVPSRSIRRWYAAPLCARSFLLALPARSHPPLKLPPIHFYNCPPPRGGFCDRVTQTWGRSVVVHRGYGKEEKCSKEREREREDDRWGVIDGEVKKEEEEEEVEVAIEGEGGY